jgi:hypothetical protein
VGSTFGEPVLTAATDELPDAVTANLTQLHRLPEDTRSLLVDAWKNA